MAGSTSACTDNCGDLEYGHLGVYGTIGVPAPGNYPGSRFGGVTWTDKNGSLWLFGGLGPFDVVHGSAGNFNDLWRFNPFTNEWAWMAGSTTPVPSTGYGQPGVYGTLGVAAAANTPGGRVDSLGWLDRNGNFWLFGGYGTDSAGNAGYLNDLWEFSPTTNEWAWMGGSKTMLVIQYGKYGQSGIYGTLGNPAPGNIPGGRSEAVGCTDSNGSLWLFGGSGFDSAGTIGALNDLWRFDPATDEWTWMSGSSTVTNGGGVYGTMNVAAAGNTPGPRTGPACWASNGNLWFFGGVGADVNGTYGYLNDLWEFSLSSGEWTWVGGSNTVPVLDGGQSGMYGKIGTPAPGNTPGGRYLVSRWTDDDGNLWLFGGSGFDANGVFGNLDDLWKFDPATSQWAWSGGNSTTALNQNGSSGDSGVYGTLGTAAAGNLPGGRTDVMSWTDSYGYFWLFGGYGIDANERQGVLNDFWKYQPPSAIPPNFALSGTPITVDPGTTTGNTSTVSVTPSGGFTGSVSLSCTITPVAASDPPTCSIPASATISSSSAQTIVLSVATTAPTSASRGTTTHLGRTAQGVALASILMVVVPRARRNSLGRIGFLALLSLGLGGVVACGGGSGSGPGKANPGTTPGAYSIEVTGTSGTITQTATISLVVR